MPVMSGFGDGENRKIQWMFCGANLAPSAQLQLKVIGDTPFNILKVEKALIKGLND